MRTLIIYADMVHLQCSEGVQVGKLPKGNQGEVMAAVGGQVTYCRREPREIGELDGAVRDAELFEASEQSERGMVNVLFALSGGKR